MYVRSTKQINEFADYGNEQVESILHSVYSHNEQFETPNLEEEFIRTHYRKPRSGETATFVSTAEILQRINALIKTPLSAIKTGLIMRKMEFECCRANSNSGYRVIELNLNEITDNKSLKGETDNQKLPF